MFKSQSKLLKQLIKLCEKENYNLLNYNLGDKKIPCIADIMDENGRQFKLQYNMDEHIWEEI